MCPVPSRTSGFDASSSNVRCSHGKTSSFESARGRSSSSMAFRSIPKPPLTHVSELRAQVAPDLFAGFDARSFPESSLEALGLAAAVYRICDRVGERVSLALRDALFEAGRNIGDPAVLRSDRGRDRESWSQPWMQSNAVIADWEEGKRRGVHGFPNSSSRTAATSVRRSISPGSAGSCTSSLISTGSARSSMRCSRAEG